MKNISSFDFSGKRVLIRVDFNVPLDKETFEIRDDTRIHASLPTLNKVLESGGSLVILSHLGRPKNGPENRFSLKHLVPKLETFLGRKVHFFSDCIEEDALKASQSLKPGEVILLENLRFYKEEQSGNELFAQQLAHHGNVYINDAFGTAHRAHASTTVIANYFPENKMFGYLLEAEIESVEKFVSSEKKPVTAIIGGAKVSSKIGIIENLLPKIDNLLIGGGMTYTFIKARGGQIGNSLVEPDQLQIALDILAKAQEQNVKVYLPEDSIVAQEFDNNAKRQEVDTYAIPATWMGMDIGSGAIETYSTCIKASKSILWNGPMGVFEMDNFSRGTKKVAEAIVLATKNGAYSLIGGGDSVAAINKFGMQNDVTHVSTGGGAMLEYLEGKTLPGIKAIRS